MYMGQISFLSFFFSLHLEGGTSVERGASVSYDS